MGKRLDQLKSERDALEEAYVIVISAISEEVKRLAIIDSLETLAAVPGVLEYLDREKFKAYVNG